MNVPVRVQFSLRAPLPPNPTALPFPKTVIAVDSSAQSHDEPRNGFLPDDFARDLAEAKNFKIHIGIGASENPFFPTLSFSDFNKLNTLNTLSFISINKYITEKYQALLQTEPSPSSASLFLTQLKQFASNPEKDRNVLLFPGRWAGFDAKNPLSIQFWSLCHRPSTSLIHARERSRTKPPRLRQWLH